MGRRLIIFLVLAVIGCGGELDSISVELDFLPRDLPAGTARLRYYVLWGTLSGGSQARCEDFMGASAPKHVLDFPSDIARNGSSEVTEATGATVLVDKLSEGSYLFYLEALDASSVLVGCGCGTGTIVKGQKTLIAIRLVADCRN